MYYTGHKLIVDPWCHDGIHKTIVIFHSCYHQINSTTVYVEECSPTGVFNVTIITPAEDLPANVYAVNEKEEKDEKSRHILQSTRAAIAFLKPLNSHTVKWQLTGVCAITRTKILKNEQCLLSCELERYNGLQLKS